MRAHRYQGALFKMMVVGRKEGGGRKEKRRKGCKEGGG